MILDRFRLTDRVAIVTGSGRGIGAAVAIAMAEAGADVAICSRTADQLDVVAKQISDTGRRALVIPADVRAPETAGTLVEQTIAAFGRVDIVVNNAGGTSPRAFLETSSRMLERSFQFNVTTAFELSKCATPQLLASGNGSIVNISSAIGRLSDRGFIAYGTAKAALSHMTRLMAADLSPRVRVNAIAVGSVATSALETVLDNDAIRNAMIEGTPLKRLGEPEDIAAAAVYLSSPAGSWITGKVFEVDGGIEAPNLSLGLADL